MTVDLKHLTYDIYLTMPEMKQRYSIIDGELQIAASPTPDHQAFVLELASTLRSFVHEHRLGRVFVAPLDIIIIHHYSPRSAAYPATRSDVQ
jgi:hypothetical protein